MINIKKKIFFILKVIFGVIIFLTLILFFYAAFFYKAENVEKTQIEELNETNQENDQALELEEENIQELEEEEKDSIQASSEEKVKIEVPIISDGLFMTVGNKPITNSDIVNEIKTILILNNESYSDDKREELQKLAINAIIKRSIKEIELDRNNYFKFNNEDLRKELVRLAANINVDVETLKNICSSNNLDFSLIEQQVKVELFWNSLVFEIYKNQLIVNPEEVEDQLKLMENEKKMNEYLISEIIIKKVDKEILDSQVEELKNSINNEGFENTARNLSISKSAINGGDLGWIKEDSISGEIKNILINTPIGDISEPIFLSESILFFKVRDKRKAESSLTLEEKKDQLVYEEKIKILQLYSLSHYDKLRKTISVKFKQ